MEQHRNPGPPILRQYNDGMWYIIKETRTPEGGIAITLSDVTELHTANARYSDSLLSIVRAETLYRGDIDKAFNEITEAAANTLNVERSSIWLYADNQTKIRCTDLYERGPDRHSEGVELTAADFPAYFAAMDENRAIGATDAHRDPRTCQLSQRSSTPLGITWVLGAPVRGAPAASP